MTSIVKFVKVVIVSSLAAVLAGIATFASAAIVLSAQPVDDESAQNPGRTFDQTTVVASRDDDDDDDRDDHNDNENDHQDDDKDENDENESDRDENDHDHDHDDDDDDDDHEDDDDSRSMTSKTSDSGIVT